MSKLSKMVEEILIREQDETARSKSVFLQSYYKTQLPVLGLSLPAQRKISGYEFPFSSLAIIDQLNIWDEIFHASAYHETKFQALFFLERVLKHDNHAAVWKKVKHWVRGIDNWAHSDSLSSSYSRMLEADEAMIYPQLLIWNSSGNPWTRRQSVVSLLYYRRNRKRILPFHQMISLVENLLLDDEYYVQKGVGWTLRELWQVDEKRTAKFIEKHLHSISPVAYTAAVEKVPEQKRNLWKSQRKINRVNRQLNK